MIGRNLLVLPFCRVQEIFTSESVRGLKRASSPQGTAEVLMTVDLSAQEVTDSETFEM